MELIDEAFKNLQLIITEKSNYKDTIITEEDTRLKIINRVLTEVLGFPLNEIHTEEQAGSGFIDYKLTVNHLSRFIVEAKKDSRELGVSERSAGRSYKLNGSVFTSPNVREGIEQAIRYCGQKSAELACVTNGDEWVVFRGSRLGDGQDTMEGMAFVFPSLESVIQTFALFYDLISYESVTNFKYRAFFQEAEGKTIRTQAFRRSLRDPKSRKLIHHSSLSSDLDRVMTSFFRRISGDDDPDILSECFVITKESSNADERLARISEDLVGRIRELNTANGEQLTELIERVKKTHRNEFTILVGTKGAGKTTFIDRFFRHVLSKDLSKECIVARINLSDSKGDESAVTAWLDQTLLETLEKAIFSESSPTFDDFQGIFFDEYQRRSTSTLKYLYETNKEEFKIDFGRHIEKRREERPHEYIQRLVADIVKNRKKIPCIVFDNADHFTIEFQERVFQYARSIYEKEICLIILPITDKTSWQISRDGALKSFESETLFLPTPSPKTVLMKRTTFLEQRLSEEKKQPGRGYFTNRGIGLSIDNLAAFTITLQNIFLKADDVSWWIGNFANNDIRQSLEVAKSLVTSPHLEVDELLKTYIADSSIYLPPYKIKRALIKGNYDIFSSETHKFIRNIYAIEEDTETTPLLALRILQLLRDAQKSDSHDPFITVDQVIEYFRAMLIEPNITSAWLSQLLKAGLCLNYDPTLIEIKDARKIQISPSGFQHLRWGIRETDYIQAMLEVTPIADKASFDELNELSKKPHKIVWSRELEIFINYLISEDDKYCKSQDHDAYSSQKQIILGLKKLIPRHKSYH